MADEHLGQAALFPDLVQPDRLMDHYCAHELQDKDEVSGSRVVRLDDADWLVLNFRFPGMDRETYLFPDHRVTLYEVVRERDFTGTLRGDEVESSDAELIRNGGSRVDWRDGYSIKISGQPWVITDRRMIIEEPSTRDNAPERVAERRDFDKRTR